MAWLKDVYLDIGAFLFIIIYAIVLDDILEVIIWVYTALLLAGKLISLFMPALQRKAQSTSAPTYFYHLIYALTIIIFLYTQNYYLTGCWSLIWIISVITAPKTRNSS